MHDFDILCCQSMTRYLLSFCLYFALLTCCSVQPFNTSRGLPGHQRGSPTLHCTCNELYSRHLHNSADSKPWTHNTLIERHINAPLSTCILLPKQAEYCIHTFWPVTLAPPASSWPGALSCSNWMEYGNTGVIQWLDLCHVIRYSSAGACIGGSQGWEKWQI